MSAEHGASAADLNARLVARGRSFDFFQLVHLLERITGSEVRIGGGGPFEAEKVRLRPDASLGFAPADVSRVEPATDAHHRRGESWSWRVTVAFMGLYGASSPTPTYLSELIGFTDVDADELVDFLDIFNHRILSLYYRAWLKHRYAYRYERGAGDAFSSYLLAFAGMRDEETRRLAGVPPARLIKYLGLLGMRTRPAVGLARLLGDYLKVPVEVEPWQLRWVPVPVEGRNRLGVRNCTLGSDCTVGERVPDRAGKIRIAVGPLPLAEYEATLPDTERFRTIEALTRLWTVGRFTHDTEVRLHGREAPPLRLAQDSHARLGWTSWVCGERGVPGTPAIVFASRLTLQDMGEERA